MHLLPNIGEASELLAQCSFHINHVKHPVRTDDQRLRQPFHIFKGVYKEAVKCVCLGLTFPALTGRIQFHDAIVGKDAQHRFHLFVPDSLRKWLEKPLLSRNVDQPGMPDLIVLGGRDSQRDRLAFETRFLKVLVAGSIAIRARKIGGRYLNASAIEQRAEDGFRLEDIVRNRARSP
jgi:hypothetical protein